MKWVELRIELSSELVEPVSEAISRNVPQGVSISLASQSRPGDDKIYEVSAWLPLDERYEEHKNKIEESLWHLSLINPIPPAYYEEIIEDDWKDNWKANYKPISVGERLLIVPAWFQSPAGQRLPISIEHGMAFGTGTHPSTQLCLQTLEKLIAPGDRLLDIGTGTGILSIAAILLGAEFVLAVDVDKDAVEAARLNCENNHVGDRITIIHGSLVELRETMQRIHLTPSCCVINMVEGKLMGLLEDGVPHLLPAGSPYIFSGLLDVQLENFLTRCAEFGLTTKEILAEEEWRAVVTSN